jgi:SAM-dependent methyltransferase
MNPAYGSDLAFIHDVGYGELACAGARHLVTLLRKDCYSSGPVIELGSGSGLRAEILTAAGFGVLGIDQSQAMTELARARVPGAKFITSSFLDATLPACIAVTAFGEALNYLFDKRNSPAALVRLFRRVRGALIRGGVFLFDVAGPGRVPGPSPQYHSQTADDWAYLAVTEEKAGVLTRRITAFRCEGELYRRTDEVHRLRLYDPDKLTTTLRGLGFRVTKLNNYDGRPFVPGCYGMLARKA